MENHLDKSQKGVMFFVCTHHTYWGFAACPQCQEEKNQQFCSLLGKIVMKAPTKEQLNDPQWWDENADPYATHYCPESRSFGFVSSAARECCYARPFNKEIPDWDGEGLPPVGAECEIKASGVYWVKVQILAYGKTRFIFEILDGQVDENGDAIGGEQDYFIDKTLFRPIRTKEHLGIPTKQEQGQ